MFYNIYQHFFKTIFSLSKTHTEYPNRNLEHNLVFLMNHQKMTFEEYPQLSSLHNHQMARTHPLMRLNKKMQQYCIGEL